MKSRQRKSKKIRRYFQTKQVKYALTDWQHYIAPVIKKQLNQSNNHIDL